MESFDELEIKRPRRSCTQKEIQAKEQNSDENSESDISEDTPDNSQDEDFSLVPKRPKKPKKKKERLKRSREKQKRPAIFVPSYEKVESAHSALQQRFTYKNTTQNYTEEDEYSSEDEFEQEPEDIIEEQPIQSEELIEPPQPEQTKKKRIVIRPWNPMWYQIQH